MCDLFVQFLMVDKSLKQMLLVICFLTIMHLRSVP